MPFRNPQDKKNYMEDYHGTNRGKYPKFECPSCTLLGRWRGPKCGVCVKADKQRKPRVERIPND